MRLSRISEFQSLFSVASRPTRTTVLGWIEAGVIKARKIGRCWYIDLDEFEDSTGNELADRVPRASGRTVNHLTRS